MSENIAIQSHLVPNFPFEKLEPEIENYLQRLFTSTELDILKQVWNNYYSILYTEKYLTKYFHIHNQKFEDIINIAPSLYLQFNSGVFVNNHAGSLNSATLEELKLKFISQCFTPHAFSISAILGDSNFSTSLNHIDRLFSSMGNEINPLGIPTYCGDIKFCEPYNNLSIISLLGVGLCKNQPETSKNKIIIVLSDKKDEDYATWAHSTSTPPNTFYNIRLKHFIQDANKDKTIVFNSFPFISGLYASAFMFAHTLQKGIILECEEIAPHYSQILLLCDAEILEQIDFLTNKWQLEFFKVGKLVHDPTFKIKVNKQDLAEIPLHTSSILLKNIDIPDKQNNHKKKQVIPNSNHLSEPDDYRDAAWNLFNNFNLKSKDWVMEKFDSTVGTNNIHLNFPACARILNIKNSDFAINISAFNHPIYFKTDPEKGAHIAIAELTRKISCSGGIAKVLTANFLLPSSMTPTETEKLQQILKGLYTASRYFSLKINQPSIRFVENSISGEMEFPIVTLYCTGVIENKNHITTIAFKNKGDMIYLIGKSVDDIQSSLYLQNYYQVGPTNPPYFDLQEELNVQDCIKKLIQNNLIRSANDVSTGGLFKSLTDSGIIRNFGYDMTTDAEIRKDAFLFGEAQSRIIVSVTPHRETEFIDSMMKIGVPFSALGHVTKEEIRIDDISYGFVSDFQKEFFTSPQQ